AGGAGPAGAPGGGGSRGGGAPGGAPRRRAGGPPAAREAARLSARGDEANAISAARRVAPPAADISVRSEGNHVVARVTTRAPLLPMLTLRADAIASREPGTTP
ncbi:TadE family type IV pilus minor pilin, partial [Nocardia sp. NPDC056564]|uniref:TadE family type IV pilus minor pilin n=1 Tax=Nocardia sp. NPDC056564 TaxID=3345865 RepID=UPI00366B1896